MNNAPSRSTLFLTELVIDLFIFIVCAAVCVGLLVQAHSMSRASTALTEAVYIAQSAAERYRAGETPAEFYRADGTACQTERELAEAAYHVSLAEAEQVVGNRLPAVEVRVFSMSGSRDEPCYTLTVKSIREVTGP